jgi:hypothetical protein
MVVSRGNCNDGSKFKLQNQDVAFVGYLLALALTTRPDNSGNLDPVLKSVQLRTILAAVALKVFSLGNIVGCTHKTQQVAPSSKTGDGRNEQWIVNSHIGLAPRNDVYN